MTVHDVLIIGGARRHRRSRVAFAARVSTSRSERLAPRLVPAPGVFGYPAHEAENRLLLVDGQQEGRWRSPEAPGIVLFINYGNGPMAISHTS